MTDAHCHCRTKRLLLFVAEITFCHLGDGDVECGHLGLSLTVP